MHSLLPLIPVLGVFLLLASGRVSALASGLTGLALTVAVALGDRRLSISGVFLEAAAGAWLSWLVIAIIASGMFFHRCTQARQTAQADQAARAVSAGEAAAHRAPNASGAVLATPRRLWAVCFLLAPFAESVTGFGVGYIIALGALGRLGLTGVPAGVLGLYSQTLVPWGALAIGSTVGAAMAGMTPTDMGVRAALLQAPMHAMYLLLYWRFARAAGCAVPLAQKLDDLVWTAALIGLLWAFNALADLEIAGAAATALLLALRFWRDERPDTARLRAALREHLPYVLLTVVLCSTRLIGPLRETLKPLAALQPFEHQPAFAPFFAPGVWLVAVGVWALRAPGLSVWPVVRQAAQGAWRPCAVTLAFIVMAQIYVGAGLARDAAAAGVALAGQAAVAGVPLFAAVAGFLTGGGSASNAMLMPMVAALARALGANADWLAAVQNSVSTNLTMLSPIRVAMGAALIGLAGAEGRLYRRAWPLALPPLIAGLAAVVLLA
jgi:lactate permease